MVSKNYKRLQTLLKGNTEALKYVSALNDELENEAYDIEDADLSDEIDFGIGKLHYQTDNLVIEEIIEALGERIDRDGILKVRDQLQSGVYEGTTTKA